MDSHTSEMAPPDPVPKARGKRARQDGDASSPQTAATAASTAKKRKISGTVSQSPLPPASGDVPEAAAPSSTRGRGRGRGRGGTRRASTRGRGRGGSSRGGARVASQDATVQTAAPAGRADPYELPDSEEERVSATITASGRKMLPTSRVKPLAGKGTTKVAGTISSKAVYEMPGYGDGASSSKAPSAVPNGDTPPKVQSAVRGAAAGDDLPRDEGETPDIETEPDQQASGSQQALPRQRAKRTLEHSVMVARGPTKLKGILTPAKGMRAIKTGRKNVVFDGMAEDQEMSFADIPTTTKKKTTPVSVLSSARKTPGSSGKRGRVSQREEAQAIQAAEAQVQILDYDDVVCVVCSRPESAPPNEILFCDKCDRGYHQQCYDVPVIPEGDWLCRDCLGGATGEAAMALLSGLRQQLQAPSIVATRAEIPDIPNFGGHLQALQRVLLSRCTGNRRIKLRGQDKEYSDALQLVEQTVLAGEGNSLLVIGARGCGKTTLIEGVISELSAGHKNEFHVVRLNGFIHTDDKIALKEIWRQLGKEMDVEDELVNKTNNYADTLASLLAVLSHPSEMGVAGPEAGITSKSVVFVMDEFDLFTTHGRQTLLYNLFDIAQAKKAPIAVVGLTSKVDVVESLEKRVKSRFSHRYVYLSLPKTVAAYWDVCRQGLTVDEDDMLELEGVGAPLGGRKQFYEWWDKGIEATRQTRGFQDHLEYYYYTSKSVGAFLESCILPLSTISPTEPWLRIPARTGAEAGPAVAGLSLEAPDSKLPLMESLSDLDLALLISAARLDVVAHMDTVNFAMAYDEYTSLMGRQRVQSATAGVLALGGGARTWGRGVAGIAWEHLISAGLLRQAAGPGRGGAGSVEAKMWKVDVALEEIPVALKPSSILARWCREV